LDQIVSMAKKKVVKNIGEPKSKGLFDHIGEIRVGKNPKYFDTLTEADKKTWTNYMVCRVLSMQPELIEYINEIQKYSGTLAPRDFYKVLIDIVPRGKAFYPFVKSAADKYNPDLIKLLILYFSDSERNVLEYISLLTRDDLRSIVRKYGYTDKQVEKLMEI
jgi:hypothetical protein